jgi:hypothetical protein
MQDKINYVQQNPLNQHPQDQTGPGLSNIPDY